MYTSLDPDKNARKIRQRNLSFERVLEFDWESACVREDLRKTTLSGVLWQRVGWRRACILCAFRPLTTGFA